MSSTSIIEKIYGSLQQDNLDLDTYIAELKTALKAEGKTEAVFDASRLPHNNRQGRKLMQSYFKRRGITVSFDTDK